MIKIIYLCLCFISVLQILFAEEKVEFYGDFDDELMRNNYNSRNDYHIHDREIDEMNEELLDLNKINAQLEWESAIKVSNNIFRAKKKFYSLKTMWKLRWCNKFKLNQQQINIIKYNNDERRMIYLLCHRGPKYSLEEIKRLSLISDQLVLNYKSKKICRLGIDNNTELVKHCYHGEHEVKLLMQMSRNEEERRWAWISWRNEMKNIKNLFIQSVAIQNAGARRNGYADMGVCWREEMEIPGIENLSNNLWLSIKPLYKLLHAVVRFELRKLYPGAISSATAPIPAHLIGDLWSVNWQSLADILLPQSYINITNMLIKKNYTVNKMMSVTEDFFTSLNFPPMTNKFWTLSIVTRRNNSVDNCYGSARNMYELNDFRILACFEVDEESFKIIHHEMGHVQYYMAYQNQPVIYQNGVNSAFHESIGDAIFLGAMTSKHLHRLGLIDDNNDDNNGISRKELALLLKLALTKIPQIPYALLMDKWRWRVFEGAVDSNNYNKAWWDLHRHLMGIVPPNSRQDSTEFFDPAAKYHIITNTPYLRYFLSHILQFQIFDTMCKIAVNDDKINYYKNSDFPLYKCDIYGAKIAGNKLRKLMKMGSSIKTHRVFNELLNTSEYCVDSLLKYFQPIKKFLEQQIRLNNIPIGWN
ncbi:hypothetical protein PV328_004814 [Microctonus aethiopoides]|uniref:Angiotensin-converting enzyme n=1 Tax=Microctonus aethiopoides TaxID=144406 RepID=A0AA39KLZ2_9HYME|nr:hypothetical protein PV328_004814 [Microctonus aethiopoides]